MQREILTIAGQEVDLIPNTINRKLQINNLGSAEDRQSNYSNTVKLPMTDTNKLVFDFLGVPGNTSRAPYKQLPCSYSVDGIPLIVNGYAEVKASGEYYEVVLYDGIIDLAERLKNQTLSTLDYSDLNHYLNTNTLINSFGNTSGFIYALGDFGVWSSQLKAERQVPSIYTHTLWSKILSQAGVQYTGDFFTTNQDFLTEVITPPQGYEVQDITPTTTSLGSVSTNSLSYNQFSPEAISDVNKTFSFATTFGDPKITFSGSKVNFTKTGNYQISMSLSYDSLSGQNRFKAVLNGQTVKSLLLDSNQTSTSISLTLSVQPGDELYFMMSGSDLMGDGIKYHVSYDATASISFSESTGGFLIDFSKMMGDMSQIDFVKDIMQRFGLVLKPIRGTKDYEFIQFEKMLDNRTDADDWTDKLVTIQSEDYGIKYAKENKATYSYHEDIQVPTHDGVLKIDNDNAEPEKSLFKSPYQIPISNRVYKSQPLYYHPVWEEKDENGTTVIKIKEDKIKTFRVKNVNTSITAYYFNDVNGINYSGDVPFLSLEDMDMQHYLDIYYKLYKYAVNSYKEVSATFNLGYTDIYDLDFFKLKYLKQSGKYYYLNQVDHKVGNPISKGKLIELTQFNTSSTQFSTNEPTSQLGTFTFNTSIYDSSIPIAVEYVTTYPTPAYADPEGDAAYKIKFLNGSGPDIELRQAGVAITAGQEILFSDWNVTARDMGNTTAAHQYAWDYQIMDAGSGEYGTEVGTLTVTVAEYTNIAPTANAGSDSSVTIDTSTSNTKTAPLDGSGSSDENPNTLSYSWSITSKPSGSTAYISSPSSISTTLQVPALSSSLGTYTIRLKVTDDYGVIDTDTKTVTVNEVFKP